MKEDAPKIGENAEKGGHTIDVEVKDKQNS